IDRLRPRRRASRGGAHGSHPDDGAREESHPRRKNRTGESEDMMARRFLRSLLRVLPFDFRADYGREIEQTFDQQRRDAKGPAERARLWAGTVAAILGIGPREHLNQLRQDVTYALRGMRRDPGFVIV